MEKPVDVYMDLDIFYDGKTDERVAKLIMPFPVNRREDLFVSLVYMAYRDEGRVYDNASESAFEFCMPKCTRPKKEDGGGGDSGGGSSTGGGDSGSGGGDSGGSGGGGSGGGGGGGGSGGGGSGDSGSGGYASPVAKFVFCEIENGEYDPESLCQSLNKELQNKMPSIFRPNSCKFIWNANIARVEISIDGSTSLDPDSRATLLVYYPLTFYLGLTKLRQKGASRCFGAPYGKVTSASIVQTSHATAGYPPRLPRPEFIFWFLNVLEQQV